MKTSANWATSAELSPELVFCSKDWKKRAVGVVDTVVIESASLQDGLVLKGTLVLYQLLTQKSTSAGGSESSALLPPRKLWLQLLRTMVRIDARVRAP